MCDPVNAKGLCCLTSFLLTLLVPLDPSEFDHTSQCWSTQVHISSLPFSGYFKTDFGFGPVVSVYQSQLIELFVAEGSKEPVFESSTEVLPTSLLSLFRFGFGHKILTLLNLNSSQWTRAIQETKLEDLRTVCMFSHSYSSFFAQ